MNKLIRWLAKRAGVATDYHVAALYTQDGHMGTSTLSMTVTLRPWLHRDNYRELVEYLHTQATRATPAMPVITSITKLGV
jgi:hypothetical protein